MAINKLGFWQSTSLVVGNMIGSGIFLLPASLALFGGISLIGWLISAVGALLLASVFGNLSRQLPGISGGPYAYTRVSLDDFPAFLVAWSYWVSVWCANAAIAVALVSYLGIFFPILLDNPFAAIITGLSFIWLITWINSKPIRTVGFVQLVTTILKLTPILLIAFVGIFYFNIDNFPSLNLTANTNFSTLTATIALTFFAFLGMECATIPASGTDKPEITIKKATIVGTLLTVIVYMLSTVAIMGIIPAETLANSNAPFADAAELFWGSAAKYIVAAGAAISTLGALNGWILIQGQIPLAAAGDKLFPKIFAKTNKNDSPIAGIVISSIFVSVLMMLNYSKNLVDAFTFMMLLSTLSVILPYLFSTASFAILQYGRDKRLITKPQLTAFLAFCFSMWVIIGSGQEVVFWGFILLMAGVPFYVLLKRNVD